ncbi:large conductance mechanosensitive channel protein MscL [Acholeplasma vituli]|uniref:Large-conductance mechanosensitive channel n=1 Tax=Paracholeplasma vituli TaxID=69473 RepID=A0ABT2PXC1_9MOLU|nr:large conductance mechanosensitive channel protein MscL [Paracholeplasma vituli]MCU0104362.1 large conductance mechanosensitive channel protein MscL [Paracholeplasma vituli]
MKFVKGFKAFISKGNVLDLAVGVIMATAFGKIVTSMINDILFPIIAALLGEADFKDLVWEIRQIGVDVNNVPIYATMKYGNFIQVIFEFLIIALFVYIVIIQIVKGQVRKERLAEAERLQKEAEAKANPAPVVKPEDIQLLEEIRDLLKKNSTK